MRSLSTSLLLTMRRGRIYTAANLGRLLGMKIHSVEEALCEMVASGTIEVCNQSENAVGYRRAEPVQTAAAATQHEGAQPLELSVATYPVLRKLEGSLSGYSESINQLRTLAMLARH